MDKRKTLGKPKISSPRIVKVKKQAALREVDPEAEILSKSNLADILKECIVEGDAKSAIEAVLAYLRVANRKRLSETSHISRSTIEHVLQHGNPTAEILFKLLCA
jgi:DNA-binding phage protein